MNINDRIVNVEERARLMAMAHKLGYKVYQRNPEKDSWFYYTDGTNIGYAQFSAREMSHLSTVHKPNRTTGTGYQFTSPGERINPDKMTRAMLCHAPGWASDWDRKATVKWSSWDAYHKSDAYRQEYKVVTE